jgi:hypothetical protein
MVQLRRNLARRATEGGYGGCPSGRRIRKGGGAGFNERIPYYKGVENLKAGEPRARCGRYGDRPSL